MAAEVDNAATYAECMVQAKENPEAGYVRAVRWRDLGGAEAAEHCAATAIMGMGQYKEAAERLEKLSRNSRLNAVLQAQLLGQATQGWLLANEPARAEAVASSALALQPDNPDFRIDRAQAMAARGDYQSAINDLDKALSLDSSREDAYVFRASAKRFLEDFAGATADVGEALKLDPWHVDGLLERGILSRLKNNNEAARQDWLRVLSIAPKSMAAQAAQKNLELMDVKTK